MFSLIRQRPTFFQHNSFLGALEVAILTLFVFLSFALGFFKYQIAQGIVIVLLVAYAVTWLRFGARPQWHRLSYILIVLLVCATLLIPLTLEIYHHAHADERETVLYHDGALQSDIAFDYVLQGKNPYAETYFKTPLGESIIYRFFMGTTIFNPALEHYIYFPGTFLISGSSTYLCEVVFGFGDVRVLFALFFIASACCLWVMMRAHPLQRLVLIAYLFNPWSLHFLMQGRNDILPFTCLVFFVWFFLRSKYILAGILLGLALATKQFPWIFLPFLCAYIFVAYSRIELRRISIRMGLAAIGVSTLALVPYVAWNPSAFFDDTFLYASGTSSGLNYPMSGYGFAQLMRYAGIYPLDTFPFWIIMLPVAAVLLSFGIKKIIHYKTLSSSLYFYALCMLGTFFFARFFHDNYIMYIIDVALLGVAVHVYESRRQRTLLVQSM